MASSTSQNDRPVLPSIQDLLSDRDFDKLRLQSPEIVRNVATASVSVSQRMARDSKAPSRHEPILRSSCSPSIPPPRSPKTCSGGATRSAPYPDIHASGPSRLPETAGKAFEDHLPGLRIGSRHFNTRVEPTHENGRLSTAHENLAMMDLPTYVLSADQCPPDDDRRHGCGICHRRFNRPSSLMIHMNSHTGAQPFKCPFPGCMRRFSVNSNMRRHYRNHREGAAMTAQAPPYPTSPYRTPEAPRLYYSPSSSPSSSLPSSPSHTDDGQFDTAESSSSCAPSARARRSRSIVLPRAQDRPSARPRACTVPGCHCDEAPAPALRPAFQQASPGTRFSPKHR
ncbi:hypothetical protein LXA43DRAFT_1145427 [Ganoderma leucocontextum]|nr:hypothetical protein LXA43DRAFT_1145427 [Ganoderma leucocontextum]